MSWRHLSSSSPINGSSSSAQQRSACPPCINGRSRRTEGGLAAYGPSLIQIYRQQFSRLLAELLRGTKPADLPVEQPTTFELVINLSTAKALGLTIPPTILALADEVIE